MTAIRRHASAVDAPCASTISTSRSLPIISSGLCFLLGIQCPFRGPDYHSLWATQQGADQETLATLEHFVRSGRVRYLGASSMSAWRLMKMLSLQDRQGFSPFIAMQGHYNLVYREEEREMIPLCREEGLGYMAWSPLARGRLAG
ncbi:MAG: aldo/keto reductase, partial [Rhizobiaceae bacterium]